MKILNLFAGVGGNRKLWTGHQITSVEIEPKICNVYARMFPSDTIVCGDAIEYLKEHFYKYDFIWASPPCQSHSRMNIPNKTTGNIDPSLMDTITFLRDNFKGIWVVENVKPYYKPAILPTFAAGRHYFWSNRYLDIVPEMYPIKGAFDTTMKGKKLLQEKYDIHFDDKIYLTSRNPGQVMRNCVDPLLGHFIIENIGNAYQL